MHNFIQIECIFKNKWINEWAEKNKDTSFWADIWDGAASDEPMVSLEVYEKMSVNFYRPFIQRFFYLCRVLNVKLSKQEMLSTGGSINGHKWDYRGR